MLLDLPPDQQALIDRVAALARERFAPRAAAHDQAASFPGDDLADLFAAGLNAPTVPRERTMHGCSRSRPCMRTTFGM